MKTIALCSALLFAGSPVLGSVCALECAAPTQPTVTKVAHSHCGEKPSSPPDRERDPCGHGHRAEALLSSAASSPSKTVLSPAVIDSATSDAATLALTRDLPPLVRACESPPTPSSLRVLRL